MPRKDLASATQEVRSMRRCHSSAPAATAPHRRQAARQRPRLTRVSQKAPPLSGA